MGIICFLFFLDYVNPQMNISDMLVRVVGRLSCWVLWEGINKLVHSSSIMIIKNKVD